jgi:lipopolysaccharide transport system permease protein
MSERGEHIVYIRPRASWASLDLAELWAARELMYFLTWKELKIRYKQTTIGVLWVVLQPIVTTIIFAVVFSEVSRFDSPGIPYPLVVLSGLLVWLFISNAIIFASNSLVGASDLVTKIFFPRLMLPLAPIFAGAIDLAVGLVVLVIALLIYGVGFSSSMIAVPIFLILSGILAAAIGIMTAALNVRFRDIKFALPFLLQIWMFSSPVFYPMEILSPGAMRILKYNPLTGIVSGFRSAIFGSPIDWTLVGISTVVTLLLLALSIVVFKRMEDSFADHI